MVAIGEELTAVAPIAPLRGAEGRTCFPTSATTATKRTAATSPSESHTARLRLAPAAPVADPVRPHVAAVSCAAGSRLDELEGDVAARYSPEGGSAADVSPAARKVPRIRSTEARACFDPKSPSAIASSPTLANRRSRSFSRHVAMTGSMPGGRSLRRLRAGGLGAIAIWMTSPP